MPRLPTPAILATLALLAGALGGGAASAQSTQETLFSRIVLAGECKLATDGERSCRYALDRVLSFVIRDAGGANPTVSFTYSNINEELYAIHHAGCVGVLPGTAHLRNYAPDYGVYVSTRTGRVYPTVGECASAR